LRLVARLQAVLAKFQQSQDFRQLAERTRKGYAIQIKIIEHAFGAAQSTRSLTRARIPSS
jgi:hypothetical protein